MTAIPKCTSWRGHKFEGRYSSTPVNDPSGHKINAEGASAIDAALRLRSTVTYERDICVRCGATVEKAK